MSEILLSVIIPAFNEEKRIPQTLIDIDAYLRKQEYGYEIIVVDDGSSDGTVGVVEDMMNEIRNLKLIENKKNQGKGYSVRRGMIEAGGRFRLFTDADNSTSIDQVERMWPAFDEGFDVVIGSRDVKGAVLDPPQPWYRRRLGDVFNVLVQVLLGLWGVWDTQCGFKGFKKEVVEKVFPMCRINRFAFDPEILILSKRMGYKIKEIPVIWRNNLESKVNPRSVLNMAIEILKIKWNIITHRYEKK